MKLTDLKAYDLESILFSPDASPEIQLEALNLVIKNGEFDLDRISRLLYQTDSSIRERPLLKKKIALLVLRHPKASIASICNVILHANKGRHIAKKASVMFMAHPDLNFEDLAEMLRGRKISDSLAKRCFLKILNHYPERLGELHHTHHPGFLGRKLFHRTLDILSETDAGRSQLVGILKSNSSKKTHRKIFKILLAHTNNSGERLVSLLGYAQERFLARKVLAELLQKSDTYVSPLFFQALRSVQDLSVKKYIARKIVTDKFPRPKQAAYLLDQEFAFLPTATLRAAARILAKSVDKISHEIIQPLLKTRNDNVAKILFDRIVELRNEGAGGIANEFQLFWQIFRDAKSPHAQNRSLGILMSGHPDLSKNHLSIIARRTKDPGRGKAALSALLKHPEINYSDICTIADHSNTPEVREAAARALSTEYNVFLGDMLSMKPTLRSR